METVKISPPNAQKDEGLFCTLSNLRSLSEAIDTVFGQINDKIDKYSEKVSTLRTRIDNLKKKVDNIKGINTSTTIYSSNKFPIRESDIQTPTGIFQDLRDQSKASKCRDLPDNPPSKSKLSGRTLKALLQRDNDFYSIYERQIEDEQEKDPTDVLGVIPDNLSYVSSLLLFNTNDNLYKEYRNIDNLEEYDESNEGIPGYEQFGMEDLGAGLSFDQMNFNLGFGLDYEYKTDKTFEFEDTMTLDLPNIAKDVNLGTVDVLNDIDLGDLEVFSADIVGIPGDLPPADVPEGISEPPVDVPIAGDAAGGPGVPPPPPGEGVPQAGSAKGAPPPPPPPGGSTAPPPPPPPADAAPKIKIPNSGNGKERMNLLASIRKGKALKPAAERKVELPKSSNKKSPGESDGKSYNILDSIKQAMLQRRDAIDGGLEKRLYEGRNAGDDDDDDDESSEDWTVDSD